MVDARLLIVDFAIWSIKPSLIELPATFAQVRIPEIMIKTLWLRHVKPNGFVILGIIDKKLLILALVRHYILS